MNTIPFGEKLKRWRGNLPRKQAAAFLGVPVPTYDAWERGTRTPHNCCVCCLEERMFTAGIPIPHAPAPLFTT